MTGLYLQFFFAAIMLRLDAGDSALRYVGSATSRFLQNSYAGAKEVFGPKNLEDHFFVFVVSNMVFLKAKFQCPLFSEFLENFNFTKLLFVIQLIHSFTFHSFNKT